jgi:hypothetical protein
MQILPRGGAETSHQASRPRRSQGQLAPRVFTEMCKARTAQRLATSVHGVDQWGVGNHTGELMYLHAVCGGVA